MKLVDPKDDFGPVDIKEHSNRRYRIALMILAAYFSYAFATSVIEIVVVWDEKDSALAALQELRRTVGKDFFSLVMIAVGYYLGGTDS